MLFDIFECVTGIFDYAIDLKSMSWVKRVMFVLALITGSIAIFYFFKLIREPGSYFEYALYLFLAIFLAYLMLLIIIIFSLLLIGIIKTLFEMI